MCEELVKKIRHCATYPMHCLSCGEDKDGRCFKRLMTQAADAIEELQTDKAALNGTVTNLLEQIKGLGKPRWIPVTERLPETWKPVLVTYISFNTGEPLSDMTAFLDSAGEWCWNDDGCFVKVPITHWQPLPEPPKEEET